MEKPTKDSAAASISTEVYKATAILEQLETAGLVTGNGHHMRQKVAEFAANLVRDRWKETDPK